MKLIDEWRSAWRFFSVQANAIGLAFATTYTAMYDTLKEALPPQWMGGITMTIFVGGIVARMVSQGKQNPPCPPTEIPK